MISLIHNDAVGPAHPGLTQARRVRYLNAFDASRWEVVRTAFLGFAGVGMPEEGEPCARIAGHPNLMRYSADDLPGAVANCDSVFSSCNLM